MKRFLSNKSIWIMSIIVLTVAFFLMNYFTPYVADDYNYLTYKIFCSENVCVFMVFVSFFVLTQMADTMIYSRESYIQTAERESLINEQKAAGNRNVTVPIITHAYPLRAKHDALTGLSDITSDSTYWINATIAKYYGVDSVTGE